MWLANGVSRSWLAAWVWHSLLKSQIVSRVKAPCARLQILAPLTKGGNLPFRRLCADFGAEATMSEMSFARHLLRGAPQEKALLRRAANEACFGAPAGCPLLLVTHSPHSAEVLTAAT